jgi:tetratricopeptide (TPR) repeat protein
VEAMKYFSQQIRNEPNKVGGYRSKAIIYNHLGKKDSAIRYFNMATSLDPNDNQTLLHLAEFYMFKGEVQAAVKIAKLAYAGDVMAYNKAVAIAYLYARDWQQAEAYYRKTDYRDMDYALVLWKTNRQDSARVYFKKAIDYRNSLPSNYGMDLSRIYAVLGNQKEAIQNLQLGFSLGWHWYDWVKRDPYWDEIRSTPEFKNEEQHFDQRNRAMLSQINDNEKRGVLPDLRFAQ